RGGKLPPKNQIQTMRFRTNQFAAENHEANHAFVDIQTKPGLGTWHGSLNGGFRDESLNARNAFAPFRGPEQTRRMGFDIGGPLWKGRNSLTLSADALNAYDTQTIVAALPNGAFRDVLRRPLRTLNLTARGEHLLTPLSTLRGEYQRNATRRDNLGAGNFDLAERGVHSDSVNHVARLANAATIGKLFFNEWRAQFDWQSIEMNSLSQAQTIQVLNAFTSGGAQLDSARCVRGFELADNLDIATKKHALRVGAQIERFNVNADERRNLNGTFIFSSLADFRAARPLTYSQRSGAGQLAFTQWQTGWYAQDDWRMKKSFTLSYGVRHEWQTKLADRNNWSPRLGFAWSPSKSGKTTIRGGAAVFYGWFDTMTLEQALRVNGQQQRDLVVLNPGFPDPLSGGMQRSLPPSRITLASNLRLPESWVASAGLEHELRPQMRLNARYSLRRDLYQLRGRNINAPDVTGTRPDPLTGNLTQVESSARGTSHNFNVGLNWMKVGKYMLMANYTLAKAVNESDSPFALPVNSFDLHAERGPSLNDIRHRLMLFGNYSLPSNFRISTILYTQSAPPYNVTTGFDDNRDGIVNDRPLNARRNSARAASMFEMSSRVSWGFGFGKPPEQSGGPQARMVRLEGGDSGSMLGGLSGLPGGAASKRYQMELFVQASNLLNNVNRAGFTGVQSSPFFGHATSAAAGRRFETGLRFSF
ncbi:MAG: TonB-dependent receptor, partial [Acidobacteria bacterium]|nr:TonB-dependent receptor [Acidobacteriota bacterium]